MGDHSWLLLTAALFVLQHLGVTSSRLRNRLVASIGEKSYLGLYSLASLVFLVLLVRAYNATVPSVLLWPTVDWLRVLPLAVMPLAILLLVGGVLLKNPTTVGVVLDEGEEVAVTGVMRITRHPVQCAIFLWAFSHLLVNGDPPSLIFFGSIALVSGYGMLLIDRRKQAVFWQRWNAFRDATSIIPFVAIASGRQSFRPTELGWLVPLLTLALFLGLWWGHLWVSGVSVGLVQYPG